MPDHFKDLQTFVRIAETGSLTAAASELDQSLTAVSRRLTRLEERLGLRLVNRTTRKLSLTNEGLAFHTRAARILGDLAEAEVEIALGQSVATGLLRVTTTFAFARRHLASLIHQFEQQHPALKVHLDASDRITDLVDAGFDIAIRFGVLAASSLIARALAANEYVLCAAPAYLDKRGRPQTVEALVEHDAILFGPAARALWTFADGTEARVRGDLTTNDGDLAHVWAVEGAGIIHKAVWDVAADIRKGALEIVLPDRRLPSAPIHAVFPHNKLTAAKVRLLLDFLTHRLRDTWEREIFPIMLKASAT